jgi:hypothetical protein
VDRAVIHGWMSFALLIAVASTLDIQDTMWSYVVMTWTQMNLRFETLQVPGDLWPMRSLASRDED